MFGENILVCSRQKTFYINIIVHFLTYVLKDSTWKMICTFYDSFWYTQLSFVLKCETFTLSLLRSFSFVLGINLHNIASKSFCLKGLSNFLLRLSLFNKNQRRLMQWLDWTGTNITKLMFKNWNKFSKFSMNDTIFRVDNDSELCHRSITSKSYWNLIR